MRLRLNELDKALLSISYHQENLTLKAILIH
jgi:hypothetical protein